MGYFSEHENRADTRLGLDTPLTRLQADGSRVPTAYDITRSENQLRDLRIILTAAAKTYGEDGVLRITAEDMIDAHENFDLEIMVLTDAVHQGVTVKAKRNK